jgi:predicted lipoprotein with Yx(FWY)xxD motif
MKRLFTSMATVSLAAVLAACGSSGGGSSSGAAPGGSADTVSVATVPGVGAVLVDSTGHTLYASDEEASGMVLCTGACTSFWKPLTPGAAAPTAGAGMPALGVVDRPDGTKQVTADDRPLYTFVQDGPHQVTGNGFSDDFDGQHFTWHAVLASEGSSSSTPSATSSGSGSGYGY